GRIPPKPFVSGGLTTPAPAGVPAGSRKRLVHDLADRAGAPAALRAAPEAAVDLSSRTRWRLGLYRRPHVVVRQHIARTDNHFGVPGFFPELEFVLIWQAAGFDAKQKTEADVIPDLQIPQYFRPFLRFGLRRKPTISLNCATANRPC